MFFGLKYDYGLLNVFGLRLFKDIVNLDMVRWFIVCWLWGNMIFGFICCIFIFILIIGFWWVRFLGWVCNGEMIKGGGGRGVKREKC